VLDNLVSRTAAALYQRLVTGERHEVAGPSALNDAARKLIDAGFARVRPGDPPLLVPVAPALAAQSVLSEMSARLSAWQDDAALTVRNLIQLQREAVPAESLAEVIVDPDRILPLVDGIQVGAREELLSIDSTASAGSACLPRPSPAIDDPPPVWKTIFTADFLTPDLTWILDGTVAKGGQVRIAPSLPMKLLIADRSHALIPLDDSGSAGVVSTRSGTVVGALVELFDTLWDRATSYPPGRQHPSGLAPYDLQVLSLLAGGCKDEEIAARTHVSIRTVRRSVATIFERLDVHTRFAAGVQAAKRQWI